MDHISLPDDAPLPPIRVPYLCRQLDPCAAADYLEWLRGAPAWFGACRADPLPVFAAKLQNQLYFGLLSAFLGGVASRDDFVDNAGSGAAVLVSTKVQEALSKWLHEPRLWFEGRTPHFFSQATMEAYYNLDLCHRMLKNGRKWGSAAQEYAVSHRRYHEARNWDCHMLLSQTVDVMNAHVVAHLSALDLDPASDLWTEPAFAVLFSIDVLVDQLEAQLNPRNFVRATGGRNLARWSLVTGFPPFQRSILKAGRCPSLPWRLQLSATDFYRLLYLPMYPSGQDHTACSYQRCRRFQKVETKHRDGCTGCDFGEADTRLVMECIADDAIPLIEFEEDDRGHVTIKTVKGGLHSNYTAISHVWTGGMGNQERNALPQCQLQYLLECVSDLPPPLPLVADDIMKVVVYCIEDFVSQRARETMADPLCAMNLVKRRRRALVWIDSLCIPTLAAGEDREGVKAAKNKAIDSMAQLYAGAEKVLVLDPEVWHLPSAPELGRDMLALYIRACPWMGRSWPLQEGALGQNLFFRLRDRSEMLEEARYRLIGLPSLTMTEYYDQVKGARHGDSQSMFVMVWNSLVTRSTTQPEDLPAILAAMMECSAEEVRCLPAKDRMKALLQREKQLPLALLYQPFASAEGDWAPDIPGADVRQTFIYEYCGSLRPVGGEFVVEEIRGTYVVFVDSCPDSSSLTLQAEGPGQSAGFIIEQRVTSTATKESKPRQAVFFLSNLHAVGPSKCHGARFSVVAMDSKELRLRPETDILWSVKVNGREAGPSETIHRDCRLLGGLSIFIDLGSATWPALKWTRKVDLPVHHIVDNTIIRGAAAGLLTFFTEGIVFALWAQLELGLGGKQALKKPLLWAQTGFVNMLWMVARATIGIYDLFNFARLTSRSVQTLWAVSFYDSASLPEKRASFEESTSLEVIPFRVPSATIGSIILLLWALVRRRWVFRWALLTLAEKPVFYAWRAVLRRSGLFTRETLDDWWTSDAATNLWTRMVSTALLLVIPVAAIIWWVMLGDYWMTAPYAAVLCSYPVWLYYDFTMLRERFLVEDRHVEMIWAGYLAILMALPSVMVGVRYDIAYWLWAGVGCLCIFCFVEGYLLGGGEI